MTLLLSTHALSKTFGSKKLFSDISFSIFSGDRLGLIGPNGSGKSTLLKILCALEKPDEGSITLKKGTRVGYLPQSCTFEDKLPKQILIDTLCKHSHLSSTEAEIQAEIWLSKLLFQDDGISASHLSGGWKKRLGLARELIKAPDLLLLDEPTNHLDLEGILWLEKFLIKEAQTYVMISHDRLFLENTTNRIMEIDRAYPKGFFSPEGSYYHFLEKKELFLKGQLEQERSLSSKARREIDWLRTTPQARTTKSKARIEDAHELLSDLSDVKMRNQNRRSAIDFSSTHRKTQKLVTVKNVSKKMGSKTLFLNANLTLSPDTRMALMGPNGSGKTTLLRLIAGEIESDEGTIKKADDLKIVYFDQHRAKLEDHLTLKEALSPNGEFVTFRGSSIHVSGWAKRFLFSPDILDMPIEKLSGGERARISIARLMQEPADVLLLDEPTNDLDIATLETLEENLRDFPGAIVLITHDRHMLDRLCNVVLALSPGEEVLEYPDFAQWQKSVKEKLRPQKTKESKKDEIPPKQKLSFLEKRQLQECESKITNLENTLKNLNHQLLEKEILEDSVKMAQICTSIGALEKEIEDLYVAWDRLEKKQKGL